MTTVQMAWRMGRAQRRPARSGPSLLERAIVFAGRKLPTWRRVRTAVMQTSAFAAADFGLFHAGYTLAGFIGVGVSLLLLEALGGERA